MYATVKDKVVEIWSEGAEAPSLRQPNYPSGEPFDTDEEAMAWAEMYIESVTDPDALQYPTGKDLVRLPKPTPQEQRLARLSALGITPDDLKEFLAQATN